MSAATESVEGTERTTRAGIYMYAVLPSDVEVDSEARGVGDPPAPVKLVRHDKIAALVSEIDVERPLGRPDELLAHERLLDATAAEVPVLPIRFGAVLADKGAVVDEFLAPHHDEFDAALQELDGKAEYIVRVRYVEAAVLGEIVRENPEVARLREAIRGKPEDVTRNERMRLGELINQAIEAKRQADTQKLTEVLTPLSVGVNVREPSHELDAANVAALVETAREAELVKAVEGAARDWDGRAKLRLLGPLAPYDFVTALKPEG
ncbi:GvpL/GvpF family gas vesicle protein [Dactylosporangium sp. NPDC048998]|uniref:GvpL/GvpF family gas vesicle protein n=1 Tax=Dactylosporangium sp. NPDC048998 TaxID=3363976 RepID=UPI0037128F02